MTPWSCAFGKLYFFVPEIDHAESYFETKAPDRQMEQHALVVVEKR